MTHLSNNDIIVALRRLVETWETSDKRLINSLAKRVFPPEPQGEKEVQSEAVTPTVFGSGGYAFLWEDVLHIERLLSLLVSISKAQDLNAALADVALQLVAVLNDVRSRRVSLTEAEFQVLCAIRSGKGAKTAQDVSKELAGNLNDEVVLAAINKLQNCIYTARDGKELPLVRFSAGGMLSSNF